MRRCVGCCTSKDKNELIRIVMQKDGNVFIDVDGNNDGRGAYLCKSIECLNKAKKNHGIARSFKTTVPDAVYEQLERMKVFESE